MNSFIEIVATLLKGYSAFAYPFIHRVSSISSTKSEANLSVCNIWRNLRQ